MLIKATVELKQPVTNFLLLNETINAATTTLSERHEHRSRIAAIKANETSMILLGVINNGVLKVSNPADMVDEYMSVLALEGKVLSVNETTADDFWGEINDTVFERRHHSDTSLDIDETQWLRYVPKPPRDHFYEHMVTDSDMQFDDGPLYKSAMDTELSRIAQNANAVFVGHPVHYVIKAPVKRIMSGLHNKLTMNLVKHHRLTSQHVVTFEYEDNMYNTDNIAWDTAMTLASGGSMLLDLSDGRFNETGGFYLNQVLDELIRFMRQYEHKVLFTIRYTSEDGRVFNAFMEKAGGFSFVRIEPILMTYDQAVALLTSEAKAANLNPEHFIPLLDKEQLRFNDNEVMELLMNHQSKLLKSTYFPEYSDISAQQVKIVTEQKGKAYSDLMNLIGLGSVKALIERFVIHQNAQSALLEMGISQPPMSRHMVFTGSPGTAKTTVARLIGKILRDQGILKHGDFFEVSRADLVAEYIGQTAVKVRNLFKKAQNSVLFIDECYDLLNSERDMYGLEAIAEIVLQLENNRDNVVVIFAGYPDLVEQFLSANPGLKSRINYHIHFPDYSDDELLDIAQYLAKQQGYTLTRDVERHLSQLLRQERSKPNFANGRIVRNFLEEAIVNRISRLFKDVEVLPSKEQLTTLEVLDFKPLDKPQEDSEVRLGARDPKKSYS